MNITRDFLEHLAHKFLAAEKCCATYINQSKKNDRVKNTVRFVKHNLYYVEWQCEGIAAGSTAWKQLEHNVMLFMQLYSPRPHNKNLMHYFTIYIVQSLLQSIHGPE